MSPDGPSPNGSSPNRPTSKRNAHKPLFAPAWAVWTTILLIVLVVVVIISNDSRASTAPTLWHYRATASNTATATTAFLRFFFNYRVVAAYHCYYFI